MVQSVLWECAGKAAVIALTDGNGHFSLLSANGKLGRKQQKSLCLSLCFFLSFSRSVLTKFIYSDWSLLCLHIHLLFFAVLRAMQVKALILILTPLQKWVLIIGLVWVLASYYKTILVWDSCPGLTLHINLSSVTLSGSSFLSILSIQSSKETFSIWESEPQGTWAYYLLFTSTYSSIFFLFVGLSNQILILIL